MNLPPELAERWTLDRPLGKGASATTYAGRRRSDGKPVALKVLRFESLPDWKTLELFEREADALASLRTQGVPRLYAHERSEDGAILLLAQELIEGPTLEERVRRAAMPADKVKALSSALLRIAEAMHTHAPSIVHRDIKPSNVVLGERVHLVDFGGVRFGPGQGSRSTVVGTFGYMAPEQLWGAATPQSDLYGIGATALFAATGKHPDEMERDGLSVVVPRNLPVSPSFRAWMTRMSAADPAARFSSAADARSALSATSTTTRVRGGANLLGGPSVALSPTLDAYKSGRGEWALPLPKASRRAFRPKTVKVAIDDDRLSVGRGRAAETFDWSEIATGSLTFGLEAPVELRFRLETATTPAEFGVVLPTDGACALVGAIWERVRHRPGLRLRAERLRHSRALGVEVPADIWEAGDTAIVARGGAFDLRCELSREPKGPKWQLSAGIEVPVHAHVFFASGGRRASRASVVERFLDDDATRAAWLLLTQSPPDPLAWSDLQVCGERLTWSARAISQPHAVETFELALCILAWRMMRFGTE